MLSIPEAGPWTVRIVGIDPGTFHLGVAVLDWEWGAASPRVVYAATIHVKDESIDTTVSDVLGKCDVRLDKIKYSLVEILKFTQPLFVISETPFLQRGKLSAFRSGVEIQKMLRDALFEYDTTKAVHGINPKTLKNYLGVEHVDTTKQDVMDAVCEHYKDHTDVDLRTLDEHSCDAIGAAHYLYRSSIQGLGSLVSPRPRASKKNKGEGKKRRRRRRKK